MKRPSINTLTDIELKVIAQNTYEDFEANFDDALIYASDIFEAIKTLKDEGGYEYAKELESGGADIDVLIVEELDGIAWSLQRVVDKNVEKWVKDNSIEPLFQIGDVVQYKWGLDNYIKGIIGSVNLEKATYNIPLEEKGHSAIVMFENVKEK